MISADLSNIGAFAGAVEGTLRAVESPGFKGDFTSALMNKIRKAFMADAIAASAHPSMKHMFEWGDRQGDSSTTPLFALVKNGEVLSFRFLPSTKPVPLPEPGRYGFSQSKLSYLGRHTFRMKAMVMETQNAVQISASHRPGLFIPTTRNKYGYVMTMKTVTINPGGPESTGGFARFWTTWFGGKAQGIANDFSRAAEENIAKTGQRVIRYAAGTKIDGKSVGGQFASGRTVRISYANAKTTAQSRAKNMLRREYRNGMNNG